ncbi:MAG: O-antigen ligase family protein [Beijerinckiaceae bacterium]
MTNLENRIGLGAFLFLLGTTVGFASANDQTLQLAPIIRVFSLTVASLALISVIRYIRLEAVCAAFAMLFTYTYGISRGMEAFGFIYTWQLIGTSFVVVIVGVFFLSFDQSIESNKKIAIGYVIFAIAWLLLLIATGALVLEIPPRFEFTLAISDGRTIAYSQGLSKLYGVTAVFSVWLYQHGLASTVRPLYLVAAIGFLLLSLLAGGRGDFAAALVVCGIMFSWGRGAFGVIKLALIIVASYFILIWAVENFSDEVLALRRIKLILEGDSFGFRDELAFDTLRLLSEQPVCLLFGCGYGYFQLAMGYEYGLYPHNVYLEALLTWGIIFLLCFCFLALYGLRGLDFRAPMVWPGVYFALLSLKSGDVLGSWLALSFLFFLAGRGLAMIASNRKEHRELLR